MIGFNKPYIAGDEFKYIQEAIQIQKLSGNGYFTKRCHEFFEQKYKFKKVLLTHSATAALEMAALLIDIKPGDEVIMPSYTFVSTANAFILRGAKIVFADSLPHHPNIDPAHVNQLITPKTRAIVVVHYAGVGCDMDAIMEMANTNGIVVIEDAAQAIDSYYKGKPLGGIGHLAAFSFHETKNIICGEGGMLVINEPGFCDRSEVIWEKGTNRAAFSRREVSKYNWVDLGSSFLPSEITAAFLYAQLQNLKSIQARRIEAWTYYREKLADLAPSMVDLPCFGEAGTNNGHIFYLVTKNGATRDKLLGYLQGNGVQAIFHYLPLHSSPYFLSFNKKADLPRAEHFAACLLRLPLYVEITRADQDRVVSLIKEFYKGQA